MRINKKYLQGLQPQYADFRDMDGKCFGSGYIQCEGVSRSCIDTVTDLSAESITGPK